MNEEVDIDSLPNGKKMKKKREFDFSRHPKRRIALMFMYFGWEYNGLVEQREIAGTVSYIVVGLNHHCKNDKICSSFELIFDYYVLKAGIRRARKALVDPEEQ